MRTALTVTFTFLGFTCVASADLKVQFATQPNLSPDGQSLLYVERGDIWRVSSKGGLAIRFTSHHASDSQPMYSPDGKQIAFISDRTGSSQVHVMSRTGGEPKQLTFHTEGYSLQHWYPDGRHLLVLGTRDHHWRSASRLMKISSTERSAENLLFDGYGSEGKVSPDGKRILFVREGERWWRKGYVGSRSAQIWLFESSTEKFTKLVDSNAGHRSPVWGPDGKTFYYCSSEDAQNGARNLWRFDVASKEATRITEFEDDLVISPTISRDGQTIVFSHQFDLYRYDTDEKAHPQPIDIRIRTDDVPSDVHRRTLNKATDAAFSSDGLEIAMISGGDLWVMETELKEPVRITDSPQFESDPVFINDGDAILYVGWKNNEPDIWKVERADVSKYWWQSSDFKRTQITNDSEIESDLRLSPNGKDVAYIRGRGDLWIQNLESGQTTLLVDSFSAPSFDFSPDGKWIVYSQTDDDFNNDIWIAPVDKSSDPVNVSRHPDDEYGPKWSTDGKMIAFSGRRTDDEVDIHYLYLTDEDDDTGSRDRSLKKSLEAFEKSRKKQSQPTSKTEPTVKKTEEEPKDRSRPDKTETASDKAEKPESGKTESEVAAQKKLPKVRIDFDNIHRRLRTISVPNGSERVLGWSPDGKKLIFTGRVKTESGTYSVTFPSDLTPKKITASTGTLKGWVKGPDRLLWLVSGVPAAQAISGSAKTYPFSAYQELSKSARYRAGFETAWRIMRDAWYDDNFGNHNWDHVRRKYLKAAESASDSSAFAKVLSLMLGELNGSHLGFYPASDLDPTLDGGDEWQPTTAHLGLRFDPEFNGPGLKVRDIIPDGPATESGSVISPGEVILSIDGIYVDPKIDLTTVLNGRTSRDVLLKVRSKGKEGDERDIVLRPISYARARSSLYRKWQDNNRAMVAQRDSNVGYLHIQGMNWSSFLDFERELYDVGYGKDGLIIDVRDNGGGSTTDHLLTALTQPDHAITVPRGGGTGYPHSRKVYATWTKPIVVLCNQNSYSNAEIFSHAIKNLKRGKLVGVPTAGGVISTGAARVMDVGTVRLPFRGWFVKDTGEDMELNGAIPHVILWPRPTEIPSGKDRQLTKAVKVLRQEIKAWKSQKTPELRKATDR
jgi:tricorn protease